MDPRSCMVIDNACTSAHASSLIIQLPTWREGIPLTPTFCSGWVLGGGGGGGGAPAAGGSTAGAGGAGARGRARCSWSQIARASGVSCASSSSEAPSVLPGAPGPVWREACPTMMGVVSGWNFRVFQTFRASCVSWDRSLILLG